MALRFRKSKQLLPGVRLNVGKKGVGLSFGVKGLRHSINTSGRRTTTVGVPGTGISYSKTASSKSGKKNDKTKNAKSSSRNVYSRNDAVVYSTPKKEKSKMKPMTKAIIAWILAVVFLSSSFSLFAESNIGAGFIGIVLVAGLAIFGFINFKKRNQPDPLGLQSNLPELHNDSFDEVSAETENSELTEATLNYEKELLSKLAETETANDIMDIHYAYNNLIEFYYKYRQTSDMYYDKAMFYSQRDIDLFSTLKPLFMADLGFVPRIPSFQRLAMLYDQRGEYEKAIDICSLGIKYDLADGTQGGFRARREKVEKKLIESQKA